MWPPFPVIDDEWSESSIYKVVLPHIVRFWKEAQKIAHEPQAIEAREMINWVKGDEACRKRLLNELFDILDSTKPDEEDCKRCGCSRKQALKEQEAGPDETPNITPMVEFPQRW